MGLTGFSRCFRFLAGFIGCYRVWLGLALAWACLWLAIVILFVDEGVTEFKNSDGTRVRWRSRAAFSPDPICKKARQPNEQKKQRGNKEKRIFIISKSFFFWSGPRWRKSEINQCRGEIRNEERKGGERERHGRQKLNDRWVITFSPLPIKFSFHVINFLYGFIHSALLSPEKFFLKIFSGRLGSFFFRSNPAGLFSTDSTTKNSIQLRVKKKGQTSFSVWWGSLSYAES